MSSTGGSDKFETVVLGQTSLLEAGEHKLEIIPKEDKWGPMDVLHIKLEPVE